MRKVYALILTVMVLALAACGKQEVQSPTAPAQAETSAVPEQTQVETVAEEKEASEEDFRTESLGDGRCEIVGCGSEIEVIRVPETLYGETVVGIGTNAFCGLEAKKIILPDTVEYLGRYAFNTCEKLEELELGSGLKKTGLFAISFCHELCSVTFPEGMEEMTEICFGSCLKLGEVYVPASVTKFANMIVNPALCPEVVIVTPAGSAAEANAQEYGIPYRNP